MSNYILYNFEDKSIELYKRLKLNVDLCDELGAGIYSFPMKYHPMEDPEYFSNRDYIGKYWNRKFIRTIQAILNSTKGKVGKGHDFFCKAFGSDEKEYYKLLYMPEAMIIYRFYFEGIGMTGNQNVLSVLRYYTITRDDAERALKSNSIRKSGE